MPTRPASNEHASNFRQAPAGGVVALLFLAFVAVGALGGGGGGGPNGAKRGWGAPRGDRSTRASTVTQSLVKGEEEVEHDLWRKHFKQLDSVTWSHFALVLSLEFGKDLQQLPKELLPTFGKKFVDKDGLVSHVKYNRFVTQFGLHGLESAAQGAVNKTFAAKKEVYLRGGTPLNPRGRGLATPSTVCS